jgi:hypothetical protein
VRTVAVNAITLPVSWIGRVRFKPDSRIERIDVDPVLFEPGAPAPTAEGRTQVTRLAAFLDELPAVRMSVTPVVSARDVEAMRRRAVEAAVAEASRGGALGRDAALMRVFADRFRGQPAPATPDAAFAALLEAQTVAPDAVTELGEQRLKAVRASLGQAGIDTDRLAERKLVQREGREGQVEIEVLEAEGPRPSKFRDALRRLGVPLKSDAEK